MGLWVYGLVYWGFMGSGFGLLGVDGFRVRSFIIILGLGFG